MDRLQLELQRLYGHPEGPARSLVLQVAAPAAWDALKQAWQGVQADLQWPAPAIAVTGSAYQLWFSLAEPVSPEAGLRLLSSLCRRYLADVPMDRIAMFASHPGEAGGVPPQQVSEGRWSAFVAPDLAALFADEPWLDLAPGADAQAELLAPLQPTKPEDWQRALELLAPAAPVAATTTAAARYEDPRQFLLDVMNDRTVDLQLRIEAARALLPYCGP